MSMVGTERSHCEPEAEHPSRHDEEVAGQGQDESDLDYVNRVAQHIEELINEAWRRNKRFV